MSELSDLKRLPTFVELEEMSRLLREKLGNPPYTREQVFEVLATGAGATDAVVPLTPDQEAILFLVSDFVRNWSEAEAKRRSGT